MMRYLLLYKRNTKKKENKIKKRKRIAILEKKKIV